MAAPTLGFSSLSSPSLPPLSSLSSSHETEGRWPPFPCSHNPRRHCWKPIRQSSSSSDPLEVARPRFEAGSEHCVVMVGSRQYIVSPGGWIHTQMLKRCK